jgi:hypothetical protein
MTTWCSAENERGTVRVRGVGSAVPLSRGGADGHGGPRWAAGPASLSMWLLAVTHVSGTALSRSARVARPTVPTIVPPARDHQQGSYVLAALRALHACK